MVTWRKGKPCRLQGDLHKRIARPQIDIRMIWQATAKQDR